MDRFFLESACLYQIERVYLPQIILTMKRFILLFALLGLVACGQKTEPEENTQPQKMSRCEFLAVDAFTTQLTVEPVRQGGDCIGFRVHLNLPSLDQSAYTKYIQDNHITDSEVTAKADQLKTVLEKTGISYVLGERKIIMMCGGVSGPVKVYSNQEVNGRAAGEDLSDMFVVLTLGHVGYPKLDLREHKDWMGEPPYVFQETLVSYFKENTVPFALDESLQVPTEPSQALTGTFTFEIPVTGVSKSGEVKTVVFKGSASI